MRASAGAPSASARRASWMAWAASPSRAERVGQREQSLRRRCRSGGRAGRTPSGTPAGGRGGRAARRAPWRCRRRESRRSCRPRRAASSRAGPAGGRRGRCSRSRGRRRPAAPTGRGPWRCRPRRARRGRPSTSRRRPPRSSDSAWPPRRTRRPPRPRRRRAARSWPRGRRPSGRTGWSGSGRRPAGSSARARSVGAVVGGEIAQEEECRGGGGRVPRMEPEHARERRPAERLLAGADQRPGRAGRPRRRRARAAPRTRANWGAASAWRPRRVRAGGVGEAVLGRAEPRAERPLERDRGARVAARGSGGAADLELLSRRERREGAVEQRRSRRAPRRAPPRRRPAPRDRAGPPARGRAVGARLPAGAGARWPARRGRCSRRRRRPGRRCPACAAASLQRIRSRASGSVTCRVQPVALEAVVGDRRGPDAEPARRWTAAARPPGGSVAAALSRACSRSSAVARSTSRSPSAAATSGWARPGRGAGRRSRRPARARREPGAGGPGRRRRSPPSPARRAGASPPATRPTGSPRWRRA